MCVNVRACVHVCKCVCACVRAFVNVCAYIRMQFPHGIFFSAWQDDELSFTGFAQLMGMHQSGADWQQQVHMHAHPYHRSTCVHARARTLVHATVHAPGTQMHVHTHMCARVHSLVSRDRDRDRRASLQVHVIHIPAQDCA